MTWRRNDFAIDSKAGKKFSAIFEFQNEVVVLVDLHIWIILVLEKFAKRNNEVDLAFEEHELKSKIFQFLCQPSMIGMKMRDEKIFDFLHGNPLTFEFCRKFWKSPGPATVNQKFLTF